MRISIFLHERKIIARQQLTILQKTGRLINNYFLICIISFYLYLCRLIRTPYLYGHKRKFFVRIPTNKVTLAGLLVAIGIIYGDIGTSPLYVFGAIIKEKIITDELILGGLSCIIWTLTLQTTIKYVILTLRADNNGEGGMFSLFALVRRHGKWAVIPAMMGGAAVLSEGIITPPISVTSAIEGLRQIKLFSDIGQWTIVGIVLVILVILFFLQQFGTSAIGRFFGPVMLVWFTMLAFLGLMHILDDIRV